MSLFTDDGWRNWLDCPRCGDACEEMPPNRPTDPRHPYPWWEEGDTGTCRCGAPLTVIVDDGRAWLRDDEEDEG